MPHNARHDHQLRTRLQATFRRLLRLGRAPRADQGEHGSAPLRAGRPSPPRGGYGRATARSRTARPPSSSSASRCSRSRPTAPRRGSTRSTLRSWSSPSRSPPTPPAIQESDRQRLRDLGLTDGEIMDVILTAAVRASGRRRWTRSACSRTPATPSWSRSSARCSSSAARSPRSDGRATATCRAAGCSRAR